MRSDESRYVAFGEISIEHIGADFARFGLFTFNVIGRGLVTESNGGPIALVMTRYIPVKPRSGAYAYGKHPACKRIERARVSDAPLSENPSAAVHHVMRRHARRLIDCNDER